MFSRSKLASLVAEFLGVAALASIVLAVSKSGVGFSVFIAAGVGVAMATMALAVGGVSGAHFNPAVTLGLWTTRKLTTVRAAGYIAAQFLGGYAAFQLYQYLVNQPLNNIASKKFDWRVLLAEGIGAFLLVMVVSAAVYRGYRGLRFAVTLGGAVFLGALFASISANGLANPAIALGVNSWSWAYVAGPLLGGVVGANLYGMLLAPEETRVRLARSAATSSKVVESKETVAKTTKVPAKKKTTTVKQTTKKPAARTKK